MMPKSFIQSLQSQFLNQTARQSMIMLQAMISFIAIMPFTAWRFIDGQYTKGLIDIGILMVLLILGYMGYRGIQIFRTSLLMAFMYTAGLFIAIATLGPETVLWLYVVGVAVHLILRMQEALLFNAIQIIGVMLLWQEQDGLLVMTTLVTFIIVVLFVLTFSGRMGHDNRILKDIATRDALTGAMNRGSFDSELTSIKELSERFNKHFSLIIIDIDHFKSVNDTFGHPVGDEVLKRLVAHIKQFTNDFEKVYRYGGEEFCIIWSHDENESLVFAEQLRQSIEHTRLLRERPLTVSMGISSFDSQQPVNQWIRQADIALYHAKENGRNQVCIFSEIQGQHQPQKPLASDLSA